MWCEHVNVEPIGSGNPDRSGATHVRVGFLGTAARSGAALKCSKDSNIGDPQPQLASLDTTIANSFKDHLKVTPMNVSFTSHSEMLNC